MYTLPRLILAKDLTAIGRSSRPLSAAASAGNLVRIRHGVYVEAEAWKRLKPWDKYRLKIDAAAETLIAPTVFCRHSSAAVWGVPTILRNQPVHALTSFRGGGRSRAGVRRHLVDAPESDAEEREGLLVTSRVATVLDLAAFVPFAEALVPLDHVLKPDAERCLPALSKEELLAALLGRYVPTVERRVLAAIEFADPLSASPGESYSRGLIHGAGFAPPTLQYEVRDAAGRIGFTDFYWKEAQAAGEFDGVDKYMKPEYLNGRTPGQVVVDEKMREDRIRATGVKVIRWGWTDLRQAQHLNPASASSAGLLQKLEAAGVPRRRRSSAGAGESSGTRKRSADT
jgi:hypothetical protein